MKQAIKRRDEEIRRHDKIVGTYVRSCYYFEKSREQILVTDDHVNDHGTSYIQDLKKLPNGRTKFLINNSEYPQELIDAIETLEDPDK